jgi:glycerophosphoryl diester phosphodiesterase
MRPLVISHAACGGHAPENTLAGIRAALDLNVDAIEIDVQATADGVPILLHDLTLDRTTNGRGKLKDHTLEQLRALDAGGGEPPPTFAEALDLTRGRALLVTEIKRPGCEEAIAAIARDAKALADVMAWSFLPPALEATRAAEPRIPGALLISPQSIANWPAMRELALRLGLQAISVFHSDVSEKLAAEARRSGLSLYAWTADEPSDIRRLIDLGVDGIVSNYPDRVLAALNR